MRRRAFPPLSAAATLKARVRVGRSLTGACVCMAAFSLSSWEKILLAARIIAAIENPEDVVVVSSRQFGQRSVFKFAQVRHAALRIALPARRVRCAHHIDG